MMKAAILASWTVVLCAALLFCCYVCSIGAQVLPAAGTRPGAIWVKGTCSLAYRFLMDAAAHELFGQLSLIIQAGEELSYYHLFITEVVIKADLRELSIKKPPRGAACG